ncbi:MAG: diguanylate cyclase [Gemmatimonadota bacterium]
MRGSSVAIVIIMLITAAVPFGVSSSVRSAQEALYASQTRLDALVTLLSLMQDAETGQRGFVITGEEKFLEPYFVALSRIRSVRSFFLSREGRVTPDEFAGKAFPLVDLKLAELGETIALRRTKGFAAVQPLVASGTGKNYMDDLRQAVGDEISAERQRLTALQRDLASRTQVAAYTGLLVSLVSLTLLLILLSYMLRVLASRRRTGDALRETSTELASGMNELRRRNSEISAIAEMGQTLKSALSVEETFGIIAVYCGQLFPHTHGTLYLFRHSHDLLEQEAHWGHPDAAQQSMPPEDCWAVRRGHLHRASAVDDIRCAHYRKVQSLTAWHICVPLTSQGEVLGLLYMEAAPEAADDEAANATLALTVSEQIALAISNARLREALKRQSIIDPLTELFNRRYMDETLKRELSRALRQSGSLSLVVVDVDHFKAINDTYGHDAGDLVLRSLSLQMKSDIRASDLACRYGGEELVLILPDCDKHAAAIRAEKIRSNIALLRLRQGNQDLGEVTASFGISTFPEDGQSSEALFHAADQALYSAKKMGRNCVRLAS